MTEIKLKPKKHNIIASIEEYLKKYLSFVDQGYAFAIALYIAATYCWQTFDAFPYMCITSLTKQSGKTLLADLMSFASCRSRSLAGMTAAGMFHCIEEEKPVLFFDEAEMLNSEAAGMMRSVLNVGYRRGSKIPRIGKEGMIEYETYCPKVFILIGDVYDTLRDRSIIIRMKRGKGAERCIHAKAKSEGKDLREELKETLQVIDKEEKVHAIKDVDDLYRAFPGLSFINPRDEEIWTPLFVVCELLCPERLQELNRICADMSTEKSQQVVSYRQNASAEEHADSEGYAIVLLRNIIEVAPLLMEKPRETKKRKDGKGSQRATKLFLVPDDLLEQLKKIDSAPWRKYKGGLTRDIMADLLSRHFGIKTMTIRSQPRPAKPIRAYDLAVIQNKANEIGVTQKGDE